MPITAVTYQLNHNGIDRANDDLDSAGAVEQYAVDFTDTPAEATVRKFMALSDSRIPPGLSSHIFAPFIYVVAREAVPFGGPLTWMVTITYRSIGDPLTAEPEEQWLFATSRERIERSELFGRWIGNTFTPAAAAFPSIPADQLKDQVIRNSADEPADPEVLKDFDDIVYRHIRNEAVYDKANALKFKNAINSQPWKTFPIGTVKLKVFSGVKLRAASLTYWQVTYEFHIRASGWLDVRPNVGFRTVTLAPSGAPELDSDNRIQYETITDKDGNALIEPVELDESSQILKAADLADNRVALAWRHNPSEDFETLGIAMTV